MGNFKKNSKKVLSGVILSSIVLGSTVLSNVSSTKCFAMQKSKENVKKNFLETDVFSFLLKKISNKDLKDLEAKWNWKDVVPDTCDKYLEGRKFLALIKIYKFAENNCKNDNFEIKSKAEALLKKLEEIFNNVDLIKQKVKDYLILLNEDNIELDGSSTGELGLYKSLWENISGSEKTSDDDSLSLKLSDMLKLSRILYVINCTCSKGIDDKPISSQQNKVELCDDNIKVMAEPFYQMIELGPKIFDLVEKKQSLFSSPYVDNGKLNFFNMSKRFIFTLKAQSATFKNDSAKEVSKFIIDYLNNLVQLRCDQKHFFEILEYFYKNRAKIHGLLFNNNGNSAIGAEDFFKNTKEYFMKMDICH